MYESQIIKTYRSYAKILAEIAELPPFSPGSVSSYKCPRKNGPPAVYHNFPLDLEIDSAKDM